MRKIVEYYITIRDVMRNSEFIIKCDTEAELKQRYEKYKKDTDYDIISMHSMLIEIRPISSSQIENIIM